MLPPASDCAAYSRCVCSEWSCSAVSMGRACLSERTTHLCLCNKVQSLSAVLPLRRLQCVHPAQTYQVGRGWAVSNQVIGDLSASQESCRAHCSTAFSRVCSRRSSLCLCNEEDLISNRLPGDSPSSAYSSLLPAPPHQLQVQET